MNDNELTALRTIVNTIEGDYPQIFALLKGEFDIINNYLEG